MYTNVLVAKTINIGCTQLNIDNKQNEEEKRVLNTDNKQNEEEKGVLSLCVHSQQLQTHSQQVQTYSQ